MPHGQAEAAHANVAQLPMTVRDSVHALMRELGMTTVFGNPGSTELPFLDRWPDDFRYVLGLLAPGSGWLREAEIGGRLREQGAVIGGGTPEGFASFIAAQTTALGAVIRDAGIRAE